MTAGFRWTLQAEAEAAQLFPDDAVVERHVGRGEYRGLEFLHVNAQSMLNEVAGAPFGFRWTLNAYRGCSHACAYCFARPTHAYLGLGIGDDFDRKIVVKVNAAEVLAAELRRPRWRGDTVAMGTNTDPYQRAEGRYRLTRSLVRTLVDAANPFSILTKSPLLLRDLDLLTLAARRGLARACLSIGTLDASVAALTEPGAAHPQRRMAAVAKLNAAGVPCDVLIGPVLPGLSDRPEQLSEVIDGAVAAGASKIVAVPLHLRGPLRDHLLGWARANRPELAEQWGRTYARRSYLPRARQDELAHLVAELVVDARSRLGVAPAAAEGEGTGASETETERQRGDDWTGADGVPVPAGRPRVEQVEQLSLLGVAAP